MWAAQLFTGVFHLDITSAAQSGVSGSFSIYFSGVSSVSTRDAEGPWDCGRGVFIAEEVHGVGDMESGDTTMVDVETLLEAFLEDFQTWDYFPQLPKYEDFWSVSIQIKGILLQADLILRNFILHNFTLMQLQNLQHFSNLRDNFPFNAIWHRRSMALLMFCRRLSESGVTIKPSVTCTNWLCW
jgi:hypothetical protein